GVRGRVPVIAELELEPPAADPAAVVLLRERELDAELHAGAERLVDAGDRCAHPDDDRVVLGADADGTLITERADQTVAAMGIDGARLGHERRRAPREGEGAEAEAEADGEGGRVSWAIHGTVILTKS